MIDHNYASAHEREIIRRAIAGDAHAFAHLYSAYLDRIYRYVYYRLENEQEAEDVTETVFMKAWKAIENYQDKGKPFRAWLYRIASNTLADNHRAKRDVDPLRSSEEMSAEKDDPEVTLTAAEEVRALRKGIRSLPEESQQVILLRFVEGLSHAEVAEVLGKTEGACRVIQHRALSALKELLNGRI
jgi:RNA polymerase sigma-70 factor (ECF subfamily)